MVAGVRAPEGPTRCLLPPSGPRAGQPEQIYPQKLFDPGMLVSLAWGSFPRVKSWPTSPSIFHSSRGNCVAASNSLGWPLFLTTVLSICPNPALLL